MCIRDSCGTTPEHIKAMKEALGGLEPLPVIPKNTTMISSYSHSVSFDGPPVLIGERLNPTGKQKLKSALREGNISYILEEALRQQEAGAMALDVNVGLPEIDEAKMLSELIPVSYTHLEFAAQHPRSAGHRILC